MPKGKELKVYQKLNSKLNTLVSVLNKENSAFLVNPEIRGLYQHLDNLHTNIHAYYQKDDNDRYRILSSKDVKNIQTLYSYALQAIVALKSEYEKIGNYSVPGQKRINASSKGRSVIQDIDKIIRDDLKIVVGIDYRDGFSLPVNVYKLDKENKKNDYVNGKFKEPGFAEYYNLYSIISKMSRDEVLEKYIKMSPEQVLTDYKKQIDKRPHLYEYINDNKYIDTKLKANGDVEAIDSFLNDPKNKKIPYKYKKYLMNHKESQEKAEQIKNDIQTKMNHNEPVTKPARLKKSGANYAELDVHQTEFQTSANGCWSCSAELMLKSRGITNVSQQNIRGFRHKLGPDDVVAERDEVDTAFNRDTGKNFLEMGDSILCYAPNSMIQEVQISPPDRDTEKNGVSSALYLEKSVEQLKKTILHALKEDRSPLALHVENHYITIVGIDGDTIKYKDSRERGGEDSNSPDHTYEMSLYKHVKKQFLDKDEHKRKAIQISWMSDIKLCKGSNSFHNVPSNYLEIQDDGTLKLPPNEILNTGEHESFGLNKSGQRLYRAYKNEESYDDRNYVPSEDVVISITEKIYMPKKLDVRYLRQQAASRSNEEERKLNAIDKDYYGLENPRKRTFNANNIRHDIVDEPENEINEPVNINANNRLKTISEASTKLYKSLKSSTTMSTSANPAYGELLDHINDIRELSTAGYSSATRRNIAFSENDLEKLTKSIEKALKNCKEYLDYKNSQMEADPSRKNKSGKQGLEQRRIANVIASYEKLMEIKSSLSQAGHKKDVADRSKMIEQYKKALLSTEQKKKLNDAYKSRISMDKDQKEKIERISAVFGRNLAGLDIFKTQRVFDLDKFGLPNNRDLSVVPSNLASPGAVSDIDYLSNNDFTALAFAAVTSKDICKNRYDKFKIIGLDTDTRFLLDGHEICEFLTKDPIPSGRLFLSHIDRARKNAKEALVAYKNGDKLPLAKIIKDGINNLADFARRGTAENSSTYLYYSEMGQRLSAILERDNDLMHKALVSGLKPENIAYLKSMEVEGKTAIAAEAAKAKLKNIADGNAPELSEAEREEKYTDILLDVMFKEKRKNQEDIAEARVEYKNGVKKIKKDIEKLTHKIEEDYYNSVNMVYGNNPDYQIIKAAYDTAKENVKNIQDAEEKNTALRAAEIKFFEDVYDLDRNIKSDYEKYVGNLKKKYQQQLDTAVAKSFSSYGVGLTEKQQIDKAFEFEKQYLDKLRIQAETNNLPEEFYNDANKEYQKFNQYKVNSSKINLTAIGGKRAIDLNCLPHTEKAYIRKLKNSLIKEDDFLTTIGKPGKEIAQRKEIRNYLRKNNFLGYSAKDFLDKVVKKGPDADRKLDLGAELVTLANGIVVNNILNMEQNELAVQNNNLNSVAKNTDSSAAAGNNVNSTAANAHSGNKSKNTGKVIKQK